MVTAVAPHQDIESLDRLRRPEPDEHVAGGSDARPTPTSRTKQSVARPSDLGLRRQLRPERHRARPGRRRQALPRREPDREDGAGGEPRVRGDRRPGPPRGARRRESRQPDLRPPADRHPRHPRRRQRRPRRRPVAQRGGDRAGDRRDQARCCVDAAQASTRSTPTTSRPRTRRRSSRRRSGRPRPSGSSPSRSAGSRCSSAGSGS